MRSADVLRRPRDRVAERVRPFFAGERARRWSVNVAKLSTVSTGNLKAFLPVQLRPINRVVYPGSLAGKPAWNPRLGRGFTLRCFQRLSGPDMATQPCRERDNWYTRGPSVPILSY